MAELKGRPDRPVLREKAPVGIALRPPDLHRLTDRVSLEAAFADRAVSLASHGQRVAAGRSAPFTVVYLKPPRRLRELSHTVRFERGKRLGQGSAPTAVSTPGVPENASPLEPARGRAEQPLGGPALPGDAAEVKSKRRGRQGKRRRGWPRGKGPGMR